MAAAAGFASSCAAILPGEAFPISESSLAARATLVFALTSPSTFLFAALTAFACKSVENAGVDLVRW